MARQPIVRRPAFVSFDDKFRARLSAGASALIPEESNFAILWGDPEKKLIGIIPKKDGAESSIRICRKQSHKVILISIGKFAFQQLGLSWEKIKFKRFKITKEIAGEEGDWGLVIDLAKPLR